MTASLLVPALVAAGAAYVLYTKQALAPALAVAAGIALGALVWALFFANPSLSFTAALLSLLRV